MNAPFPGGDPDTYTDYVDHAEPTVEQKLADTQALVVAMSERHASLFGAFDAMANDPNVSQYTREQIAAVLVDHIKKEWKS